MDAKISLLIGERIKLRRKELGLTQSQLCKDKITRNMLSCIENGNACPSIDTLIFLADQLKMPFEYFLSEDSQYTTLYKRLEHINDIRKAFALKQYDECERLCIQTDSDDAEILMIMAECKLMLARAAMDKYKLNTALKLLTDCEEIADKSLYSAGKHKATVSFYKTLINSIKSNEYPVFENVSSGVLLVEEDFVFFVCSLWLIGDLSHDSREEVFDKFKDPVYNNFINATLALNQQKYNDAISLFLNVINTSANFFLKYFAAKNLELCYKETDDFKNAYEYAKMRLDLLDKFND